MIIGMERPYRKGMTYNKACVGTPIIHKSDYTILSEGSVVISLSYRKIRNIVSHIEEHHFEVLKVKHADGRIESMYLPMKDDARADIYNGLYRVQALRPTCSRILCSTASRCRHLHTGRLRTVCRIWNGTLLRRTF